MNRRGFLRATGAALLLAGCSADAPDRDESANETTMTATDSSTPASTASDESSTGAPQSTTAETDFLEEYPRTEILVTDGGGSERGRVTAAIADTQDRRILGLSETDTLPADWGLLFVFERVDDRTFVMRGMNFGIDIVYADADGTITQIHHAPPPEPDEEGSEQRYPGRGQYVLEVAYEWTSDHGVREGDLLKFELPGSE